MLGINTFSLQLSIVGMKSTELFYLLASIQLQLEKIIKMKSKSPLVIFEMGIWWLQYFYTSLE